MKVTMTVNDSENTYYLNEDDQKALSEFEKKCVNEETESRYCQEQSNITQKANENEINQIIRRKSLDNYRERKQGF